MFEAYILKWLVDITTHFASNFFCLINTVLETLLVCTGAYVHKCMQTPVNGVEIFFKHPVVHAYLPER